MIENIYEEMLKAEVKISSWCSDMYVPVNEITTAIVDDYEFKCNVSIFRSNIDGKPHYDIPFAYVPYYKERDHV